MFKLKNKYDILPLLLTMVLFFAIFYVWLEVENETTLYTIAAISILPRIMTAMIVHNSAHCSILDSKLGNEIINTMLYLLTGMMTSKFKLHHNIGHHTYYLTPKEDPSRWIWFNDKVMPRIVYIIRYYITHTYFSIKIGLKHKSLLSYYIFQQILFLSVLITLFIYNPFATLVLFLIPMTLVWLIFISFTYDDHVGLYTENEYKASFSKTGKFLNFLVFNNGFHMAHHIDPQLHWSELRTLHNEIEKKHDIVVPATTILNKIFK